MIATAINSLKQYLARYLLIHPILFLVNLVDNLIGLVLPYKYEDVALPSNKKILSELTDPSDPGSGYRSALFADLMRLDDRSTNIYKKMEESAKKYAQIKTIGVREVLSIDDEKQPNGKIFKKFSLGDYQWTTYTEMLAKINNLSNGLLNIDLKSDMNVVLFAETRVEWLLSAFACFRIKVPVVTLYATLGMEALAFGINQTKAKYLVTSSEQLPKILKIMDKIPNVTHLMVFVDKFGEKNFNEFKSKASHLKVYSLREVEELGAKSPKIEKYSSPKAEDLALIVNQQKKI